jgi:hypothetical protein
MFGMLKNAAPSQRLLFLQNIAHFMFKNLIFAFLAFSHILHFSKTKKLTTLLDWYGITHIIDKISIHYHTLTISM